MPKEGREEGRACEQLQRRKGGRKYSDPSLDEVEVVGGRKRELEG